MAHLTPPSPSETRIDERMPDLDHYEGAELLANESRSQLRKSGFTDDEIDERARRYVNRDNSGDVDQFIACIRGEVGSHGGS